MNQFVTIGVVLKRVNFGEADRIITFLTPDHGKITAMARGVRKVKSKLAGGIELFSESHLTIIKGKGEIDTLVSTRLKVHYGHIVGNLDRTNSGYEFLKIIDKVTEEDCEKAYYDLVVACFAQLNYTDVEPAIVQVWFYARLLSLTGHTPELSEDVNGDQLEEGSMYLFDFASGRFQGTKADGYGADTIKLLRLLYRHTPDQLSRINGIEKAIKSTIVILKRLSEYYLHT